MFKLIATAADGSGRLLKSGNALFVEQLVGDEVNLARATPEFAWRWLVAAFIPAAGLELFVGETAAMIARLYSKTPAAKTS